MSGCTNQQENQSSKRVAADTIKKDFLPVLDFLRTEIAWVDSFPAKLVKYTIENGHKDSSIIDVKTFDSLSQEFLSPELEKSVFESNFKESSFMDETSQSLSFTYAAQNIGTSIRRVDVLASPSLGYDRVKSIYIEKQMNNQSGQMLEKMYWKSKSNFQIIRIRENPNQSPLTSQLKVAWDK
jgi:hypothetical protein